MSTPPPVHLVVGDDPRFRADATKALVADLLGDDDPSLALEEFTLAARTDAGEGDAAPSGDGPPVVDRALSSASTPPFGTERRVIVIRDVGAMGAADGEAVARYLADPCPTTALVLVGGGGRLPVALTKAVKAAGGAEVKTAPGKTGDALTAALDGAEVKFTGAAAHRVADWFGDDAGRIPALLEVLRSAYGEGARIDVDDLEPYLGEAGGVAPYLLTGAIDKGDAAGALEILHRLRGSGFHPLQVMAVLHKHYQRMLRLDDPQVGGEQDAVAALGGKVKPYPAGLALRQARLLGAAGLRTAYGHLAKADVDLRGATALPEDAVLEVLVARLAGLSRRAGAGGSSPRGRPRPSGPSRSRGR
ncbi:MAG: polymerase subunit delta [Actinomycetota bacterium]|nr:polymerase subunit delta [Actinomycetota bacterium]MDQ1504285.1 polymerase subunit delta [Actinomycetota bacterium]